MRLHTNPIRVQDKEEKEQDKEERERGRTVDFAALGTGLIPRLSALGTHVLPMRVRGACSGADACAATCACGGGWCGFLGLGLQLSWAGLLVAVLPGLQLTVSAAVW